VGILGLGYVGLSLAVEFAESGFTVTGVEIDPERVDMVNSGRSHTGDVPHSTLRRLVDEGRLKAVLSFDVLEDMDAISVCVPTPLRKTMDPDISNIIAATEEIKKRLKKGQLVVLESTTYPGTTEEVMLPRLASTGLKVGQDFFLAFSPERVDPGNRKYTTRNTPKVIGGVTTACSEMAEALYRQVVDKVVLVSNARCAEMVKLLENTFRAVNIGLVNEVALMCDRLRVNVWEVIEAASSKPFGFMPFYPGPGLGGHCIPVDPQYLSWKLRTLNYKARFIDLAEEINSEMPYHVVTRVMEGLNRHRKSIQGAEILVLGVAYKRDVNDYRESPALDVIRILQEKGAVVKYHDPHIKSLPPVYNVEYTEIEGSGLGRFDCVVIITDHSSYDYKQIVAKASLVVDTRNATRGADGGDDKIITL
jgi:UDP-N-acetyl-D-glucosamine dehydrogenase